MPWHEVCEGEEVMLGLLHCSTLTLRPRHLLQEEHTQSVKTRSTCQTQSGPQTQSDSTRTPDPIRRVWE